MKYFVLIIFMVSFANAEFYPELKLSELSEGDSVTIEYTYYYSWIYDFIRGSSITIIGNDKNNPKF